MKMPAGESEARAKTKARFEEVFKSYTDRAANNKKLKKTTSQDSIVLETFKNKFDLAKENEYETVLTGTYDPDKSPQFPKSGERDKTVGSRKINSDSHLVEGRGQRKKKNEPVEDQLKDEQFKAEYISEEMDTGQARGVDNEIFHHISGRKKQKHALKEQMSKAYEDEDEEQQLIQAYQQQVIEEAGDKVKTKSKKKTKKRLDVASNVVVQEGVLNGEVEENRVRSNAEADISRVSSSYMRQIELEDKKKKSDKNTEVFSPETEADGIDAVQKHRTVEGDQYKTKRKKVKKKAVGEESGPREVNKPISEAEDEQEQKKQVHDDSFVLGVYIHRMDRPKMDLMVSNPVVKVHVVDEVTGMYVKKENSHPVSLDEKEKGEHILPVMTQPYSFKKFKSTIPEWEELVIFNERFGYFLQESEEQPKVILFFEVLDLLCSDEAKANFDVQNQEQRFCKISWAFLKLVGANGNRNTDGKLRLQLYYPPQRKRTQLNTTEIFDWWKKYPRERSPSTLYVTVKGLKLPDQLNPLFHSTMAVHQDQGSSSHNEQQSEMANTNTNASLDGKKTDFLKWSRLPGQACRIPNKHLLSLRAGQMGCFCICFSHDGRTLAAACADKDGNPILLYEIPSGRRLREFIGHLNIVYDLCWRNDDKNFLSASSDGTVRLWKPGLHDNRSDKVLPHPSFVYAARYHPFAEYLVVTGCYDSVIRVWNVSVKDIHGQLLQEIAGHKSFINALCFDAEGLHMFSADSSGVIIVWNTFVSKSSPHHSSQKWHSDKEIIENDLKGVSVNHLEMHPNGRRLLIHAKDSILRVMDLRIIASKKFIGAVNYREKIRSTFTPCGTFLFSGSEDGTAYVWNAETGDQVAMYYDLCYSTPLRDIAFHPHEHMVAFCAFGQNQPILVYLYDHKVAQLEAEAIKDLSGTQSLSLPKGPRILTSGSDTTMLQDQSSPLFDKFASAARISTRMQKVRQKLDSVLDLTSHSVSRMELLYDRPVTSTMLDLPRESSVNNPASSDLSLPAPSLLSPHSKLRLPSTLGAQLISQQSWTSPSGGFSPVGKSSSYVSSLKKYMSGLKFPASYLETEISGSASHEKVVALYDYTAQRSDELTFHRSDIIQVLYKDNDNWWFGRLASGQQGYFPANYVAGERDYEQEQSLPSGQNSLTSHVNEATECPTPTKMSAVISKLGDLKFVSEHDDTDTESPATKPAVKKKKKKPGPSTSEWSIQATPSSLSVAADEPDNSMAVVKKKKKSMAIKNLPTLDAFQSDEHTLFYN